MAKNRMGIPIIMTSRNGDSWFADKRYPMINPAITITGMLKAAAAIDAEVDNVRFFLFGDIYAYS